MRSDSDIDTHDQAQDAMMERARGARSVDIDLAAPIKVDGVDRSSLTMRRPTVGDMLDMQRGKGSDAEREVKLIARLCDVAPQDLHGVDTADWDLLQAALLGFRGARVARGS